ncbi:MAG: DUF2490 domain-containing protein [Bacteroidia bacterium]
MRKTLISILIVLPFLAPAQPQRKTSYNDQVWFGDFSKLRLNEKWSIYFDFGLRRTEWLDKWSQTLVRPGITRQLSPNVSVTAGAAWFNHYTTSVIRPEYRGWEQLLFSEVYGRVKVSHRLRAEQRFNQQVVKDELIDNYNYNSRYRYQLALQVALNKPSIGDNTIYFLVSDEVMMNSGKEITYNYFDQNRLAAGFGYKLNSAFGVTLSYMNVFIQKNAIATYEKNNVLVINLFHEFSRKDKKND